jgi:zinc transporter ZupT
MAFLSAGLTTPLGTLTSYVFISQISRPALGLLLAFSAGTLIYVGATHLLPRAEREPRRFSLVAVATGVIVALGIIFSGR